MALPCENEYMEYLVYKERDLLRLLAAKSTKGTEGKAAFTAKARRTPRKA